MPKTGIFITQVGNGYMAEFRRKGTFRWRRTGTPVFAPSFDMILFALANANNKLREKVGKRAPRAARRWAQRQRAKMME